MLFRHFITDSVLRRLAPILCLACLGAVLHAQRSYTLPGIAPFNPDQQYQSVGVYGTFGNGTLVQERSEVSGLTFSADLNLPAQRLYWAGFNDGKDFSLGQIQFPGSLKEKRYQFADWTSCSLKGTLVDHDTEYQVVSTFSRSFPAQLYNSESKEFWWVPGDAPFDRIAYLDSSGHLKVLSKGAKVGALTAPWIVVWNHAQPGVETVPILIRLQKRPVRIEFDSRLHFVFRKHAGFVVVMPLSGLWRVTPAVAQKKGQISWDRTVPPEAVVAAKFWSRASADFPVGMRETYYVPGDVPFVTVRDDLVYQKLKDDWGTVPQPIAPVPPVTALAQASGYPVHWLRCKVNRANLATSLGPYAYVDGSRVSYEIPVPSARDNALTPIVRLTSTDDAQLSQNLHDFVLANKIRVDDASDGGIGISLKEYAQASPFFIGKDRADLILWARRAVAYTLAYDQVGGQSNLQTVIEPLTGQRYAMCAKTWCADQPINREAFAGRELDAACELATWFGPGDIRDEWKSIQGLYAYYRIYSDWAWSGTMSDVFGASLTVDGMNFAMEGMVACARMAKYVGDPEMWRDASYRSARQAVSMFASFYLPKWVQKIDFATYTDASFDLASMRKRNEVRRMASSSLETRLGLDCYSDSTGTRGFRPGSFSQASAAVNWNNPVAFRLYDEYLYPLLYKWEYQTMPRLHPGWKDRSVIEPYENQPYGSYLAAAHLDARAVVFGDSRLNLVHNSEQLQTDMPFLYRLRLALDVYQAGIPQVWAPVTHAQVLGCGWSAATKQLRVSASAYETGLLSFDWTWRGASGVKPYPTPGPRPKSVTVDGQPVAYHAVQGGFWRTSYDAIAGEPIHLVVSY
jgi:hypothetical protein